MEVKSLMLCNAFADGFGPEPSKFAVSSSSLDESATQMPKTIKRLDRSLLFGVVKWIESIPWTSWPQQNRLADGLIRPSMVTDLTWNHFGSMTNALVRNATPDSADLLLERNRLLSVVMPGANIEPHTDELGGDWLTRIHVPLTTNPDAMFISGDTVYRPQVGFAYEVNTRERHAVWNAGPTPRVHLMFDLHK